MSDLADEVSEAIKDSFRKGYQRGLKQALFLYKNLDMGQSFEEQIREAINNVGKD